MKLEINVDETMFKDILEKELKAFSKEELHEILRGCIVEFFNNNDNIKKMFLEEKKDYWGDPKGYAPTSLLNDIVRNNFKYDEPFKEVEGVLVEYCKKDDTLRDILKEMIAETFQRYFTNTFWNSPDMRASIAQEVSNVIMGMRQTGQI